MLGRSNRPCHLRPPLSSHVPHAHFVPDPKPPPIPLLPQELEAAAARYPRGLLVLTDPDVAGRQARAMLDEQLPGRCVHAFLPSPLATAGEDTR